MISTERSLNWALLSVESETLPPLRLPDASGGEIGSAVLLEAGPILVTFYPGGWCPFCNLALRALQKHLDGFTAKGVALVAISPELPDQSLSTAEKNDLKFTVLSDVGNEFARQLGLIWKQPDTLHPHFKALGTDLKARHGDDSFEVPIPCTLLVDQRGVVSNAYIETDYVKRLDASVALGWVTAL